MWGSSPELRRTSRSGSSGTWTSRAGVDARPTPGPRPAHARPTPGPRPPHARPVQLFSFSRVARGHVGFICSLNQTPVYVSPATLYELFLALRAVAGAFGVHAFH